MHIEPGIIDPIRVAVADAVALGLVATQLPAVFRSPIMVPKTILAAVAFSIMMEAWHMPVGPSELHLIGATTVYMLFGFTPAMLGFAFGLLLQGALFEHQDLVNLSVNSLSLMAPMIAAHYTFGRRLFDASLQERFSLARVFRIDAVYYAGVSAMVGFWLMISNDPVPVADWARWAVAYLPVFVLEALITFGSVTVIRSWKGNALVARLTDINRLRFA